MRHRPRSRELRAAAGAARDAVVAHDFEAFGRAMTANTDAQRLLHPALVGADADRVIALAGSHGAVGWKVNGAGGDGGSITIVSASRDTKAVFDRRVAELDARYRVLPIRVSPVGFHVGGAL